MTHLTLRRSARQAAVSAAALLALGMLAGCGSSDAGTASDAPTPATTPTDAAPTAEESSAPAPGGEPIEAQEFIDVYSAALQKASTATLSMVVDGPLSSTIDGAIDFTSEPPKVKMTITSDQAPDPQEILIIGGNIYFQGPDGTYLKTSVADSPLAGSASSSGLDPRALVGQLGDTIVSATAFGDEDVEGEVFTHYGAVLDAKALVAASGTTEAPQAALPDELALDSYFDSAGLLRRITIDTGAAAGTVDVRYDNWGEPVSIKAPPESQVQQLPGS